MSDQDKAKKARKLLKLAGRRTWERNPRTQVVPNKKKSVETRKRKHKGNKEDSWRFLEIEAT